MNKKITSSKNGVNVFFSGDDVKKTNIISMIDNCQNNQCDCMDNDIKKNIRDMQITGKDGEVNLHILGDIKQEDIENALEKSKVINGNL